MTALLIYPVVGVIAGILAGLFGIGGGVVVVPVLLYTFALQGFDAEVATHMAVATSLATIVITSISSVRAHHNNKAVLWPTFRALSPGILLGVWLGVQITLQISGHYLQMAIGCFLCLVGLQMGFALQPAGHRGLPGRVGLLVVGAGIGLLSAIFGIGGGSLTVPFLSWCRVSMQRAVATSAACGLPIALMGALTNILSTHGQDLLPAYSTGFVYWPAVLAIGLLSAPFAGVGARLAQRLPATSLKRYFALFISLIGISLVYRALNA